MDADGAAWAVLMVRAQDGDRAAYHAFLVAISPYLRSVARRYVRDADEVDDAVQEILMVVHDIRHTYERGRPLKPWLSTIASRRAIDFARRRNRRTANETVTDAFDEDFAGEGAGPEALAAQRDASRLLNDALHALPRGQREAVESLHLRELSSREAAESSHQTAGALKVACHRAIKSLRKTLAGSNAHD